MIYVGRSSRGSNDAFKRLKENALGYILHNTAARRREVGALISQSQQGRNAAPMEKDAPRARTNTLICK